jgi:hypothetical protein
MKGVQRRSSTTGSQLKRDGLPARHRVLSLAEASVFVGRTERIDAALAHEALRGLVRGIAAPPSFRADAVTKWAAAHRQELRSARP